MTKKILFGLALMVGVSSCTGDYTDWAQPQSTEQPATISFGNGSISEVGLIDFSSLADGQEQVAVCNIVAPTSSDASYAPTYTISLGDDATIYDITSDGKMSVAALQSYVENTFGKRPVEREITARINTWVSNGSTTVKLSSGSFKVKALLEAPYISNNYYLIGAPSEWSPTCTTMPFSHSDKDVYDDPTFTVMFPATSNEIWFAIADDKTVASGEWSDVLGCAEGNGNNGMEGKIARRSDLTDQGSWKITIDGDAKFVKMTINMMDYSYTLEKINFNEFFYEIGNESGWATNHALYGANYDGKYQGYYYLNGQFKFKPNADNWDGDYEYDGEGKLTQTGSDNIPDPGAGFYQIDVDLTANTYALTKVTSISAIGDFNSWGGDVDLTYNTETGAWEANDVALSGGVKFRMNHEWAVSWGGADGDGSNFNNLTQNNGANLTVEAGTYDIQLYISYEGVNKVVLTKK